MVTSEHETHSLAEFQQGKQDFVGAIKRSGRPLVLTVDGRAELVVQDAESYSQILDRLDYLEAVEAIRVGVLAADAGDRRPAREAFAELQVKLGIPD